MHGVQLGIGVPAKAAPAALQVGKKGFALAAELLRLAQRLGRGRAFGGRGGFDRVVQRIVKVQGAEIRAVRSPRKIPVCHCLLHVLVNLFLLQQSGAGKTGQVALPVPRGAQQLAQTAEIKELAHPGDCHIQKAQHGGIRTKKQDREHPKGGVGYAQRRGTYAPQNAHDQRCNAENAGKGPAHDGQRNTGGIPAVFQLEI